MINNDRDAFFVAEPSVNFELNIVSFFRIDLGTGYRFIFGINKEGLDDKDFSGIAGLLTLKFGKFLSFAKI